MSCIDQFLPRFRHLKNTVKILLIWYFLDLVFSLIIAVVESEWSLAVYLYMWTAICFICYKIRPKKFVVSAFLLAVLEETIVYFLGGGLQGTATSLLDDYAGSLPVFLMFILGWWMILKKYHIDGEDIYLLAGFHGFLLEIIVPGHIFSPLTIFLLGGSSFFIYVSIILIPSKPSATKINRANVFHKIVSWILITLLITIGGGIASFLRTKVK